VLNAAIAKSKSWFTQHKLSCLKFCILWNWSGVSGFSEASPTTPARELTQGDQYQQVKWDSVMDALWVNWVPYTRHMNVDRLTRLCDLSPFSSGPCADTEFHAGGIFFCVIYCRRLIFQPSGNVDLNYDMLDNSRSMDSMEYDAKVLMSRSSSGNLTETSRGYLHIAFPDMSFTGLECEKLPGHLAFHGTYGSEVFVSEKKYIG